jgi:hypothetical protein
MHLYADRSTYRLADIVVRSLAGVSSVQVTSLQLGHYQLIMLHYGGVSILVVGAIH